MLRGMSIALTDSLLGVNKKTITDIPRINSRVRELELSGFKKIADTRQLSSLRVIVLWYDHFRLALNPLVSL